MTRFTRFIRFVDEQTGPSTFRAYPLFYSVLFLALVFCIVYFSWGL